MVVHLCGRIWEGRVLSPALRPDECDSLIHLGRYTGKAGIQSSRQVDIWQNHLVAVLGPLDGADPGQSLNRSEGLPQARQQSVIINYQNVIYHGMSYHILVFQTVGTGMHCINRPVRHRRRGGPIRHLSRCSSQHARRLAACVAGAETSPQLQT